MSEQWTMIKSKHVIARKILTKTDFYGSIHLSKEIIEYFDDYVKKLNEKIERLTFSGPIKHDYVFFDENKINFYPSTTPKNSRLKELLKDQYLYFFNEDGVPRRPNKRDLLPDDLRVYLELSCEREWITNSGEMRRRFRFDIYKPEPIIQKEILESFVGKYNKVLDHISLERLINTEMNEEEIIRIIHIVDDSARVEETNSFLKVRRYKRWIIAKLKKMYNERCQICQYKSYPEYGFDISEAHHIEFFSKSFDNSSKNIIILCPNHHRILHVGNFQFSRDDLSFYNAKSVLPILINKHL